MDSEATEREGNPPRSQAAGCAPSSMEVLRYEHFEVAMDELGAPIKLGAGGMGSTYKARFRKFVFESWFPAPRLQTVLRRRSNESNGET